MGQRTFTLADQTAFAELSGDNNPLHTDVLLARRFLVGEPIVHGIHMLMWALDQWVEDHGAPVRLQQLRVAFLKKVGLGQELRTRAVSEPNNRVRIDLLSLDEVAVRAIFEWSACEPRATIEVSSGLPEQQPPDYLNQETIRSCRSSLDLYLHRELASRLFPNLTRLFCPVQAAVLLGMSRLVGVKCPGLQSIFSKLELSASNTGELRTINYAVSHFDDRFGLVLLADTAPGLSGTITAFIRPPPQAQGAFLDLKMLVNPGEFSGQRALVVGGSRGLGEVTAKLLAAGGAVVQITYHKGRMDATKVMDEIASGGGTAGICELDVLHLQNDLLSLPLPTHLYYFASPFISGSEKNSFSQSLFTAFCNYYVSGFASVVEFWQKLGLQNVFYPSTVFIEELPPDFAEYVTAKMAGEILCRILVKKHPGTHFYAPRLPKMATDQTVSMSQAQNADPAPIVLQALRDFRDASGARPADSMGMC